MQTTVFDVKNQRKQALFVKALAKLFKFFCYKPSQIINIKFRVDNEALYLSLPKFLEQLLTEYKTFESLLVKFCVLLILFNRIEKRIGKR